MAEARLGSLVMELVHGEEFRGVDIPFADGWHELVASRKPGYSTT